MPVSLPFRLRTALGVLLLGGLAAWLVPSLRAAARLYGVVAKVADFGLCMAGPTGANALRGDGSRFRYLVRMRLVAAESAERPFARCAKLAVAISGRPDAALGFERAASEFLEWGAGGQHQSVNGLLRVLPDLERLHADAWPIARKPLDELIRASRGAYEGDHPPELPAPTPQQGLPAPDGTVLRSTVVNAKGYFVVLSTEREAWAFRSRDKGRTFSPTSVWQDALDGYAHHCVSNNVEGTRFGLAPLRRGSTPALVVGTLAQPDSERLEFGTPSDGVLRIACDESGAVVLTRRKEDDSPHVFSCSLGSSCQEIALTPLFQQRNAALDVARLGRTIFLAWSKDGLVRVATARGEKPTLGGIELVFDSHSSSAPSTATTIVPQLFGFGRQLMLSISTPDNRSRWGLVSDGTGTGFRPL